MYKRRIRQRATVKVDAGYVFRGKLGIALEKLSGGSWLVKIGNEEVVLPLKVLRLI